MDSRKCEAYAMPMSLALRVDHASERWGIKLNDLRERASGPYKHAFHGTGVLFLGRSVAVLCIGGPVSIPLRPARTSSP